MNANIGHNSGDTGEAGAVAKDQLKSIIERVERLEEEKKAIANDIKDVFAEAKANGFDVKALKEILKKRKQDRDERAEHEAIVETYMVALGMLSDTPLGEAAIPSVKSPAQKRAERAKSRLRESMADHAEFSSELAAAGVISQEAAAENAALAKAVAARFG